MYSSFQLAKKYLKYYLHASNSKGHGIHSPFVFDFVLHVLNNKRNYQHPGQVENLRKELFKNDKIIKVEDLGAGSRIQRSSKRAVKTIAKNALKSPKYSLLFYRLCRHYQPQIILELGTSLGITTSYIAFANSNSKVTTIEGSPEIAAIATSNFNKLKLENIMSLVGNFDDILPDVLAENNFVDLAYVDGNHRYKPTINYFQQLLKKSNNDTILVFDDIHWSEEMERAWEEIKLHPQVKCTVDIFFLGFVFFKKEFLHKQHFTIRF